MVFEDGCSLGKSWEQAVRVVVVVAISIAIDTLGCAYQKCASFSIGIDLLGWVSPRLCLPKAGRACAFVFFFFRNI